MGSREPQAVKDLLASQDQTELREQVEPLAPQELKALLGVRDPRDQLVQSETLECPASMDFLVRPAVQDNKDPRELLVPPDRLVIQAPPAYQVSLVPQETQDLPALRVGLDLPAHPEDWEIPARAVTRDSREQPVSAE